MHVACIIPIGPNLEKQAMILKVFKEKGILKKLSELGANPLEIRFPDPYYTYVPASDSINISAKKKGEGILEVLRSIPNTLDYAIVCDGSGKIPYEKIVDIFSELISNSSCVMTERVGEHKAISEIRFLIERWEVFVLKHFFKHPKEIPDGQCGLWGYYVKELDNGEKAKKIKLTANSYDIELDLLSEVLCHGLTYSFVQVELLPPENPIPTLFKKEDNLRKMNFLIKKYPDLSLIMPQYLEEFVKIEEQKIQKLSEKDRKLWGEYCNEITNLISN